MPDKTAIANLALSNVHTRAKLENIDTETSTEAKNARQWFDVARRKTLRAMDWTFARKRVTLAAHGDDPPDEWTYRYQYPSDAVYIRRVTNPLGRKKDRVPYAIEQSDDGTKSIVTDQNEAVAVYTQDEEDTTLFGDDFVTAMAFMLAYYLAGPLTGKRSIKQEMLQNYRDEIQIAGSQNFNEQADDPPGDADWSDGSIR